MGDPLSFRERRFRSASAPLVTALLVGLTACGGGESAAQAPQAGATNTSQASDSTTGTEGQETTTAEEASASPLEGTWRTSAVSPREAEATLRRFGLDKWVKRFRSVTPFADTTTLILDLHEGEWNLYGKSSGGPRQEIDYDAEYIVRGNEVDKIHATGFTTYRWSVNGDTLTFKWLKSTEPPFEGVPDEVFSRALYMTQEFKRQE